MRFVKAKAILVQRAVVVNSRWMDTGGFVGLGPLQMHQPSRAGE